MPVLLVSCANPPGDVDPGDPDPVDDYDGLYDGPGAFDRVNCLGAVPVGSIDPVGIWHLDIAYPGYGNFPSVVRIDREGDALSALMFGSDANAVRQLSNDLYMRRNWVTEGGDTRVQALDGCGVAEDGALLGEFASCRNDECSKAAFIGYKVEPLAEPKSAEIELVSEFAGDSGAAWPTDSITANVRHEGATAYIVRFGDGLRIVDTSDSARPRDLGHSPVAAPGQEIYNDVKLVRGVDQQLFAIVASNVRGAVVIDVSDPSSPTEVTAFPPPPLGEARVNVHTLFIDGQRAYLANYTTGGLDIYDVSNPADPHRLGAWVHPDIGFTGGFLHDLFVDAGRVYAGYWNQGLVILDTQDDPADPTVVGIFKDYDRRTSHSVWVTEVGGRKVAVHGDEDFTAHVRIVDVDDQGVAFLNTLGEYQTRPEVSAHNIMAVGELAFVTYYQDGLRVLDLSNPTDPVEIAHYRTWDLDSDAADRYGHSFYEGAIGIDHDADRGLIYVADTHRGLFTLRLNP